MIDEEPAEAEAGSSAGNPEDEKEIPLEKLASSGGQATAIQIVNSLLIDAVKQGASDIHIEPQARAIRIRYRIDGVLHDIQRMAEDRAAAVISRIKIIGPDGHRRERRPQDGRVNDEPGGREGRTARLQPAGGLRREARCCASSIPRWSMQDLRALGLLPGRAQTVRSSSPSPTASCWSPAHRLRQDHHPLRLAGAPQHDEVNIITVEDPVEMRLAGVNQVQVHDKAGRTFAARLRSMLRQDPDIVMVGEIRDRETAEIACRAALTGHLVLSTLHTQHALGTLARIHDMGIPLHHRGRAERGHRPALGAPHLRRLR